MSLAALCARRGAVAVSRLPLAAPLSTTAAMLDKRTKADDFKFVGHCRGTRVASADSEDLKERLRKADFGLPKKPRKSKPPAAEAAVAARPGGPHTAIDTAAAAQQQSGQRREVHTAAWACVAQESGGSGQCSADEASQELVEKGSKRMMQSDEGREELSQGSFDLDQTSERVAEEGAKDASPEAAARAQDADVKEAVKSRVTSGSQTG